MGKKERLEQLAALIREHRWAALATVDEEGMAQASMVGYACEEGLSCLYLHLSRLASHTGNLLQHGDGSLVISEVDNGSSDPQQLARVSIQGKVAVIDREAAEYPAARHRYLECLPDAEPLFAFADFILFRFTPVQLRFVGGFGQAFSYEAIDLQQLDR